MIERPTQAKVKDLKKRAGLASRDIEPGTRALAWIEHLPDKSRARAESKAIGEEFEGTLEECRAWLEKGGRVGTAGLTHIEIPTNVLDPIPSQEGDTDEELHM